MGAENFGVALSAMGQAPLRWERPRAMQPREGSGIRPGGRRGTSPGNGAWLPEGYRVVVEVLPVYGGAAKIHCLIARPLQNS